MKRSLSAKLTLGLLLVAVAFSVQADDTEVFFTESEVNSNVLFIMDNSGSMGTNKVPDTNAEGTILKENFTMPRNRKNTAVQSRGRWDRGRNNEWSLYFSQWWKYAGARFPDVNIPKDAEITKAYIRFTASSTEESLGDRSWASAAGDPLRVTVNVENTANPNDYDGRRKNLRNKSLMASSVGWSMPVFTTVGAKYDTPDIKDLVQQIVNKGAWSSGNAISFIFKAEEGPGLRYAYSRRPSDEALRPRLFIEYKSEGGLKTRMQVMQDALRTVLSDPPPNLSVGIMNYGDVPEGRTEKANGVKFAVSSVNSLARPIAEEALKVNNVTNWSLSAIPEPNATVTVGNYLSEIADSWTPNGYTPIVDALYEAALYYKGEQIYFGNDKSIKKWAAHPTTYTHPDPNKVEPIVSQYNVDSCDATPREYRVWNEDIAEWRDGESWGEKCPADRFHPSGPGLASNCADTEHSCKTHSSYRPCTRRSPRTRRCVEQGEGGCRRYETTGGRCLARGPSRRDKECTYSICVDSKKPVPHYKTPIVSECQSNNIILMSDGKPEYRNLNAKPKAYNRVKSLISSSYSSCDDEPNEFKNGACGKELTHHLAGIKLDGEKILNADLISGITGQQLVNTFVIGFSSGISDEAEAYLKDLVTIPDIPETARKEGYFSAQSEEDLAAAFKKTLDEIAQEARSQASPGYSVNVKSGLEHEDDIYIPVFDKRNSSRWSGNLKKFKLVDGIGADGNQHRSIRGRPATRLIANSNAEDDYIDAMTELGLFESSAWDEWSKSAVPDGDVVEAGGTASLLTDPRVRNLYSNIVSNNLSATQNHLKENNSHITPSMLFDRTELNLNVAEALEHKKELINYIRGWTEGNNGGWTSTDTGTGFPEDEIPDHARKHMGDMLHSEPVVITYHVENNQGNGKQQYIFAATNEGYLHVFDTATGVEKFAFMPKELLKNIETQRTGEGDHKYGIDGSITYWHNDENHNGNVDGSERVLIYFGMRRGGKSYYAMDVTNINSPQLMWKVDNTSRGLSGLGQTWSMPYIANVLENGIKKPVIIFTGGNDIDQDYGKGESYTEASVTTDITATEGSNIYIVDAYTGAYIWDMRSANGISNATDVTHAIPGGARLLDVNRNGLLDRMYFADTGGDVWRLDLGEDLQSDTSKLTKFASLGGSGASSRKFYNEPDVAQLRANGQLVYSVSIGSGLRPHPMNEIIDDRMFILLDQTPLVRLADDFPTIEIGELAKVKIGIADDGKATLTHTGGDFGVDDKRITDVELSGGEKARGWNIDFAESGEKVLATSMTFEGSLMFTTLVPKALTTGELISVCAAPATQGRIYIMDIMTGEASANLDSDNGDLNDNDVFETISASEIPGTPQTVANQLECSGEHCTHLFDIRIGKKNTEATSNNVADIESIYWTDPVSK